MQLCFFIGRNLMAKEDWTKLGFAENEDSRRTADK